MVNGLREHGISTSVDDFGVGYSSFNLIREIPWNVIKIDKSFCMTKGTNCRVKIAPCSNMSLRLHKKWG